LKKTHDFSRREPLRGKTQEVKGEDEPGCKRDVSLCVSGEGEEGRLEGREEGAKVEKGWGRQKEKASPDVKQEGASESSESKKDELYPGDFRERNLSCERGVCKKRTDEVKRVGGENLGAVCGG